MLKRQRVLAEQRGVQQAARHRPFQISDILMWADAFHASHGTWPKTTSGPIPESPYDSWSKVNAALRSGLRGLQPGSSLAQLLAAHRGVRNGKSSPPLRQKEILEWADAFHSRTGRWPTKLAGLIPEAPGEDWRNVNYSLTAGTRGLPGGASLSQLLYRHRGARIRTNPPRLTLAQILHGPMLITSERGSGPRPKAVPSRMHPARRGWRSKLAHQRTAGTTRRIVTPEILGQQATSAQHQGVATARSLPDTHLGGRVSLAHQSVANHAGRPDTRGAG